MLQSWSNNRPSRKSHLEHLGDDVMYCSVSDGFRHENSTQSRRHISYDIVLCNVRILSNKSFYLDGEWFHRFI